jgi:hypothetical protein
MNEVRTNNLFLFQKLESYMGSVKDWTWRLTLNTIYCSSSCKNLFGSIFILGFSPKIETQNEMSTVYILAFDKFSSCNKHC